MPNYLKMPKKSLVLALLELGWSYRRIQAETGVRRETVSGYSAARQAGRLPLDAALGLVDSYSPGVARWMCRAGTLAGSYQAASQDLLTYAGLDIDARQIQRMIAQMAPRMTQWREAQGPVFNPAAGDIFCVSTDGTGAPMRRKELRGRKGKRGGKAHTREVKVGTVFTHHQPDPPDQRPERDYGSTSYIADIICASEFGTFRIP